MERYFNQVTKTNESTGSGYGYACKTLVNAILEVDNMFTIVKVNTETYKVYDVVLRVYDSKFCIRAYNSSTSFYLNACDENGTAYNNDVASASLLTDAPGYQYRATISRADDFMFTISCQSNYSNGVATMYVAKGVSDYDNEQYWFFDFYNSNNSNGFGAQYITRGLFLNYGTYINGFRESTSEFMNQCYFGYTNVTSTCTVPTNAFGVMNPIGFYMYQDAGSDKYWFGHVKWGGKYDVYMLFGTNGYLSVRPNEKYLVDGKTVQTVFNEMYDFVEC